MDFSDDRPIYLQIRDNICDRILLGEWKAGERIPSVREMAADVGVNPNTMMRAYENLERSGIIFNRRGVGFFVCDDAAARMISERKAGFVENELPMIFRKMGLLGISFDELRRLYSEYSDSDR